MPNLTVGAPWLGENGYAKKLRPVQVDEIGTEQVLEVLKPIWLTKPCTAPTVGFRHRKDPPTPGVIYWRTCEVGSTPTIEGVRTQPPYRARKLTRIWARSEEVGQAALRFWTPSLPIRDNYH